jgi:hypothetical protein
VQPYTLRTISVAAISSLGHTRFTGLIETEDAGTPALTGPLWGAMSYIRQGDKFNFIVFRELPEKTKIAAQSNRE